MPATVRNAAREKLDEGQLSLGVGVRMTRSVEIAKAMAVAGFDWLFLDMEHGVMSLEACAQISTAALDAGIAPIARVPNGQYRWPRGPSTMARSVLLCRMSTAQPRLARLSID